MAERCLRCRKKVKSDDFLCPNCGAILGDPVSYAKPSSWIEPAKRKLTLRFVLTSVAAIGVIAVLVAALWMLVPYFRQHVMADLINPGQTVPGPTQPTAPLAVYTVSVQTGSKSSLKGTCIHIMNGESELYSSRLGDDGVATFVLPQSDGYSIRFTDLPIQYQYHYGDSVFSFDSGAYALSLVLEDKPVPYTIKIVNSAGQPLSGTGLIFYKSSQEPQFGITDEDGICEFVAGYGVGSSSVSVAFAPNGYMANVNFTFGSGQLDFTFQLSSLQEAGFAEHEQYTIRVVDNHGTPVVNQSIVIISTGQDVATVITGYTNQDGCYTFGSLDEAGYTRHVVRIQNNPDYLEVEFPFEPESRELVIQLDLHPDPDAEYTYTVRFVDQNGAPVPGVTIAVSHAYTSSTIPYTSDENGQIVFHTKESDPTLISFTVESCPQGYTEYVSTNGSHTFKKNSRQLNLSLHYDGLVNYTLILRDDTGKPVANNQLTLIDKWVTIGSLMTDEQGMARYRHEPEWDLYIKFEALEKQYEQYLIDYIEFGDDHCIYITIAPPKSEYAYTVTFQDQVTCAPVSGVQICVDNFHGGFDYYTSDEKGMITFTSTEADPSMVYFRVTDTPDHYTTDYETYFLYNFQSYERSCVVYMEYDKKVVYEVYVIDQEGAPVGPTCLIVWMDETLSILVEVNREGYATIRHPDDPSYRICDISILELPIEGNIPCAVQSIEYQGERCIYVTVCLDEYAIPEE